MRRFLILLLPLAFLFFSCEKETILMVDQASITISNAGGSSAVSLTANKPWTVTSDQNWCKVSPSSGEEALGSRIAISCEANDSYDPRSCTVKFVCAERTVTVEVNQQQNTGLLVSPSTYDLTNAAQEISLEVQSNVQFTVSIDPSCSSWIKLVSSKGLKSSTVTLAISANTDYDAREGKVTIKQSDGSLSSTVVIRQGETYGLFVTTPEYELSNASHQLSVEVKANVDFEVVSGADWIKYVQTKGLKSSIVVLDIAANEDYDSRTGRVVVRQKGGGLEGVITVYQNQNYGLFVTPEEANVSSEGGTVEVEVLQNVDYDIVIPDEVRNWVSVVGSKSLKTDKVSLSIAANDAFDERTASITFKQKDGSLSSTVVIHQSQSNGLFVMTPLYELSNAVHQLSVEIKANVDFEVVSDANWIKYVETKALKSSTVVLDIEANESFDVRTGHVTVKQKGGGLEGIITIHQAQNLGLSVSPEDVNVTKDGGVVDIEVKQNVEYVIVIPDDAKAWISVVGTKALQTDNVSLSIAANDSPSAREASVTFKQADGPLSGTVRITQEPGEEMPVEEVVDMGLSVKWRAYNLGASYPEEYGDYFAWGETQTKSTYEESNYQWYNGGSNTDVLKYNTDSYFGSIDNKTILEPEDDAAHVQLGGQWRMPTKDEMQELIDNCTLTWENRNGVPGCIFTSKINGNSIFMPLTGSKYKSVSSDGVIGYFWSSSLDEGGCHRAWLMSVNSYVSPHRAYMFDGLGRYTGSTIRPVWEPEKQQVEEVIDLGLSVKWRAYNVGASKPGDCGDYFAWGETDTKDLYTWETYKWSNGAPENLTKYNSDPDYGVVDKISVLEPADDVAHVKLGGNWRMPTNAEIDELIATRENPDYRWVWKNVDGHDGWEITYLINGQSLFLPAAGARRDSSLGTSLDYVNTLGFYWSSSLDVAFRASRLYFKSSEVKRNFDVRKLGFPVRPVLAKEHGEEDTLRDKLIRFYYATGGPNWVHNNGWCSSEPIQYWDGIRTVADGKIEIWLPDNNLIGDGDLSDINELTLLIVSGNSLKSLNVSGCESLEGLSCEDNPGLSLNASGCASLRQFFIGESPKAGIINLSGCSSLTDHYVFFHDASIQSLILAGCTSLTRLECTGNELKFLDVSGCTSLIRLVCDENPGLSLNASGCTSMMEFFIGWSPQAAAINLSGCSSLRSLAFYEGNVQSLDMTGCTSLTELMCPMNKMQSLNVSGCTSLSKLECWMNELQSLIVAGCSSLKTLSCFVNQLTRLDCSGCTALVDLGCAENNIADLTFDGCRNIQSLSCGANHLTSLNVTGLPLLSTFECSENDLTELDFSGCSNLRDVSCGKNKLVTVNLSGCTSLWQFDCEDNLLTELSIDPAAIGQLRGIWCRNNHITQEIPEAFDNIVFYHDAKYNYSTIDGKTTYTVNDYGWYYPGEPEKGYHGR